MRKDLAKIVQCHSEMKLNDEFRMKILQLRYPCQVFSTTKTYLNSVKMVK